ncbi:uncharacterized protein J3D65DRAFT_364538 [Phyllosticta citribraziliensis]|uniref:Nucleoside 2-deoxyribosyltransferase like protein n=1 Tax=Phyllosticta citribraziliensis TaxID=989973 RepID=A0ABR1LST1_9PEZI
MSEQTTSNAEQIAPEVERVIASGKATIFKAPHPITTTSPSVFLAGSIEMGKAVDWQTEITSTLSHLPITIMNPRRPDWNNDWKQDISDPRFKEQVDWELDCQDRADVIAMYYDKGTQSPITLLELGLYAKSRRIVVACPEGYWRRGNVQVVCDRYGVELLGSLEELVKRTTEKLEAKLGTS